MRAFNTSKCLAFFLLFVSVFLLPSAHALRRTRNIPCPPVIADRATGSLYLVSRTNRKARFQCFRKRRDANKAGYLRPAALQTQNFSGWYRLRFTEVKSTCPNPPSSGPVFFLQMHQTKDGVFADLCPSLGMMTGINSSGSLVTSSTQILHENPDLLECGSSGVELTQQLKLTPAIDFGKGYAGQLSIVRRCVSTDPLKEDRTCSTTFSGPAFLETHPIWPAVAQTVSGLSNGCQAALKQCAECHAGISFPGV